MIKTIMDEKLSTNKARLIGLPLNVFLNLCVVTVLLKIYCITTIRQSLFHLGLSDGGWISPLVALHILPPGNGHKVLQFEDLHHIQVPRLVCLKVLVKES